MKYFIPALFFLSACAEQVSFNPQEAEVEIRETLHDFAEAVTKGDIDKAGSYYADTPGFYWIEQQSLRYQDVGEARASLQSLGDSGLQLRVKYTEMHISVLSVDSAIASVKFESEFTNPEGGSFGFDGWQTTGLLRTADGWKMAGGHTESIDDPN